MEQCPGKFELLSQSIVSYYSIKHCDLFRKSKQTPHLDIITKGRRQGDGPVLVRGPLVPAKPPVPCSCHSNLPGKIRITAVFLQY